MRQTRLEMKPIGDQSVKLVVIKRPDLHRFKPSDGNIFNLPSPPDGPSDRDDLPLALQPHPALDEKPSVKQTRPHPTTESKPSPSQKTSKNSPTPRPKKLKTSTTLKKSTAAPSKSQKNPSRAPKDKSPDPDDDSDFDDIALSDYSEPETKLRNAESRTESRRKFAKLRKARKQSHFKKLLTKEVNSRRIIPDSDDEIELKNTTVTNNPSAITDNDDDEDDSDSDSESEESSETDEEERNRREKEFIVDDMATDAQKNRIQKQLRNHMPSQFRNIKQDNLTHFKTVCQYLVHHALLPQISWRKRNTIFDYSCKQLDNFFTSRAIPVLDTNAWILNFRNELNQRPYIRLLTNPQGKSGCQACNNRTKLSKKILQLTGLPYSAYTLNPLEPKKRIHEGQSSSSDCSSNDSSSEEENWGKQHKFKLYNPALSDPSKPEFICGEDCGTRAVEYHFFKHWQIYLLRFIKQKIKALEENKAILKKSYKSSDKAPEPGKLQAYKREAQEIFEIIARDDSASLGSLENLYRRFLSRMSGVFKTYVTAG